MGPTQNALLTKGLCRNPECPGTFSWPWSPLGLQAPLLAGGNHFVSFSSSASCRGLSAVPAGWAVAGAFITLLLSSNDRVELSL